jgi:plastocyanin domain-containing protein
MSLSPNDWVVISGAAVAIALVNWYFLAGKRAPRAVVAAATQQGVQEVTIRVHGGYEPAVVEVAAGRPVRLTFDRAETNPCSEEVVLSAFGIRRDLPAFAKTTIEFTPDKPGRYEFTCGMGMLHGALVVRSDLTLGELS